MDPVKFRIEIFAWGVIVGASLMAAIIIMIKGAGWI